MHRLRHHPDLHEDPTAPAAPAGVDEAAACTAAPARHAEADPPEDRHLRVVEPVIDEIEEARRRSRAAHPAGTGRRRARPRRAAG